MIPPPDSHNRQRVVIIGGGLAGLAAAEALARHAAARVDITLLESKRNLGGRAGSFQDRGTDEIIDYCQHAAMGCCTQLIGLLDRCGIGHQMHRYDSLHFLHPEHPPSKFAPSRWLPAPLHLARTISSLRYLTSRQKREIQRGLFRLMRTSTSSLRDVTAADWLQQNGQSTASVQRFWDVILVSALGESTQFVAMSAARKVMMDGFAAARGASDVLIPKLPLQELFGIELADRIRALGVEIQCSKSVTGVSQDNTKPTMTTADETLHADHVICAVPWHQVSRVLAPLRQTELAQSMDFDAVSGFPTSPITGMHLWFDRPITTLDHAVMVGTRAQWLFHVASQSEHYYQVVISASRQPEGETKSHLVETVLGELHHAFPRSRDAKLLRSQVVMDPKSVFSIRPDVEKKRPDATTALPWLHLAGDWTNTGWPATMEGAVISGRLAAASVLRQSGGVADAPPEDDSPEQPVSVTGQPAGWLAKMLIVP
ncbi:hydroxysqualene dehydroxylase HpnE [Stieleria varia]|uniref:15-cis-phytoene desaturase n=1 Tax=Stieleria varia TaxID=2528005 RepID=A0A5C6AMW4_9BACT|nr:hydroxysqualene dehydroxylase HpnE [Stieleria varia]TWU00848.1 15-cis-phytoene desaturase [Stieleria varia]